MKRQSELLAERGKFIQETFNNPEQGAEKLREIADKLEASKMSSEIVDNLKSVCFVSRATIYSDLDRTF